MAMDAEQSGKHSITSTVLRALRKEICASAYADGQFITEAEVSQKYRVSKTPAREALTILCEEKLLCKIPRKGYMVKKLSLKELRKLYQSPASRRACECPGGYVASRVDSGIP